MSMNRTLLSIVVLISLGAFVLTAKAVATTAIVGGTVVDLDGKVHAGKCRYCR